MSPEERLAAIGFGWWQVVICFVIVTYETSIVPLGAAHHLGVVIPSRSAR